MALETGQHPGQLKDAVTSPGGTTIAGWFVLNSFHERSIITSLVQSCVILGANNSKFFD